MKRTPQPEAYTDTPPNRKGPAVTGKLDTLFAFAEDTQDKFTVHLYHCPTCPAQELRLTWDDLRRRHAGFCKKCRKLWPLPRHVLSPQELRKLADERQLELPAEATT